MLDNEDKPGIASYAQRLKAISGPAGGLTVRPGATQAPQAGYAGNSTGGRNDLTARLDAATKQAETFRSAPAGGTLPQVNPVQESGRSLAARGLTVDPFSISAAQRSTAVLAKENAVRQQMIDSQRGGVHIIGGGSGGMNADRQELLRKTMTPYAGAQNGQLTAAQLNAARGIMSDAQGESVKRAEINQRAAEAAQRGFIDLARQGIDMQRFGLDQQRFGMEQTEHAGRMEDAGFARLARQGLIDTANSTDPAAVNKARTSAIAAGILKPEGTSKLQTLQTENGYMAFNPATGEMRPVTGPDGKPVGTGKALNETQAKATGYGMRAAEASRIIEEVGKNGEIQPSRIKQFAESVPLVGEALGMAANSLFSSPEQQQIEQGQRDFVNAVLRQESGAAIAESEFANAQKQYFPQPGDSRAVIEQKARNRQTAINGFSVAAGPGAKHIGSAPAPTDQVAQQPQQGAQGSGSLSAGYVDGGHVFLGGNPNDPANWMEVRK